jgi:UDP-N-acetylglucosamine--N-acetylmuramyl-(pentapeptide) pyrophosphoryl-undecaprenol N-acetylglucosamine transferase
MSSEKKFRFLFTGGGTGGHLFPALAVIQALKVLSPESEFIFLGRGDKLEGKMVPQAGITFYAIPAEGFNRKKKLRNIVVLGKFIAGYFKALRIYVKFKPDAALGTGGYISAAPIMAARFMGAKTVLLESNSYPGISTKILERKADTVFLAYEQAKKYLHNHERIVVTGNPVRSTIIKSDRAEALAHLGLRSDKKTLVLIGGSLGADAINKFVKNNVVEFEKLQIQVVLQTGIKAYEQYKSIASDSIKVRPFFDSIQDAYSAGDLFVCRAGAATISELQYLGLPVILVPSPYVTDNHQYHNAKTLEDAGAATLIEEKEITEKLLPAITALMNDDERRAKLAENCKKMATPDAAVIIAEQLLALAKSNKVF